MSEWTPKFVVLQCINPDTLEVGQEIAVARIEPDGSLRVAYQGDRHIVGNIGMGQFQAALRALPWPSAQETQPCGSPSA